MTSEQEQKIVALFKVGTPYKVMALETGIPAGTIGALISRKYKHLKKYVQMKHAADLHKQSKIFQERFGFSETGAESLYLTMKDRFITKRAHARKEGIEFTLSFEELDFPTHCPILGIPLDYTISSYRADNYPSFDRTDPTKGYVPGNTKIVSWKANRIKSNGTAEEHRKIAEYLDSLKQE